MATLERQYTILETQKLLEACEGAGPGTGGHAFSTHGHLRADVTDRNKPHDSAFPATVSYPQKGGGMAVSGVIPRDMAMAVCFALNSLEGQAALKKLDGKSDTGTHQTAFTTVNNAPFKADLRIGHGAVETSGKLPRMHLDLFKINGALHIHSAYGMA